MNVTIEAVKNESKSHIYFEIVAHPNATRQAKVHTSTHKSMFYKSETKLEVDEVTPPEIISNNQTLNSSFVLHQLEMLDRSYLPEQVQIKLIMLEDELNESVISEYGYCKFVWQLIEKYVGQAELDVL